MFFTLKDLCTFITKRHSPQIEKEEKRLLRILPANVAFLRFWPFLFQLIFFCIHFCVRYIFYFISKKTVQSEKKIILLHFSRFFLFFVGAVNLGRFFRCCGGMLESFVFQWSASTRKNVSFSSFTFFGIHFYILTYVSTHLLFPLFIFLLFANDKKRWFRRLQTRCSPHIFLYQRIFKTVVHISWRCISWRFN